MSHSNYIIWLWHTVFYEEVLNATIMSSNTIHEIKSVKKTSIDKSNRVLIRVLCFASISIMWKIYMFLLRSTKRPFQDTVIPNDAHSFLPFYP